MASALDDITMVSATITLSSHLACETLGLFPIPPPAGLGDPWSLTYPPTSPGRPMVSSLPSPLKSEFLACKGVLTTFLSKSNLAK